METEAELEEKHGHCADVLMSDFGIPHEGRLTVLEGINLLYLNPGYIHCQIIHAIRGFGFRNAKSDAFKSVLSELATHAQLNTKESLGMAEEEN